MIEKIVGEIAVRVDDPDTVTAVDVLEDEIAQERGLPGPGFADAVDVLPSIGTTKTEEFFSTPKIAHADVGYSLVGVFNCLVFTLHVPGLAATPPEVKIFETRPGVSRQTATAEHA